MPIKSLSAKAENPANAGLSAFAVVFSPDGTIVADCGDGNVRLKLKKREPALPKNIYRLA